MPAAILKHCPVGVGAACTFFAATGAAWIHMGGSPLSLCPEARPVPAPLPSGRVWLASHTFQASYTFHPSSGRAVQRLADSSSAPTSAATLAQPPNPPPPLPTAPCRAGRHAVQHARRAQDAAERVCAGPV